MQPCPSGSASSAPAPAARGERPGSYACIACARPVPSLYVKYSDPTNTSLVQCQHCGELADVYQSLPQQIVLLDLLLLKPSVFRHLLRNRGGDAEHSRKQYRRALTLKLALITVGVDALVRCAAVETENEVQALLLFGRTFGYCLLETHCLLVCLAASIAVLAPKRLSLSTLEIVPLTALSALVPTTFFLVVTSIVWREEYLATPANSDGGFSSGVFAILSPLDELYRRHAAEIQAAQGDAALVSPALAYLAMLLGTSKTRVSAILLIAWLLHLVLLHAIDPFLL
ncbi:hypothetical protein JCM8202_000948 [Rhodotorula sphaerocarpa]